MQRVVKYVYTISCKPVVYDVARFFLRYKNEVMLKWLPVFFCWVFCIKGEVVAQSPDQLVKTAYSYHPPREDRESWQRLYLWLSSTFLNVINEGQVDMDSCVLQAARSIGLSRYPLLAEGFGDAELLEESGWIDQHDPARGVSLLAGSTGKKHLQMLLLLGAYYAFLPASYAQSLHNVEYFLTNAIQESVQLKEQKLGRQALCLLGKVYIMASDPRGDSIYTLLLKQCREAGDRETEAKAIAYRGIFKLALAENLQGKISDFKQAADLFHSLGKIEDEINIRTDLGYLLTITGQLEAARAVFLKAMELTEQIGFPYTHYSAHTLSMITLFQGKFGEPLLYTRQMIKVSEICRDSIGWGYFHSTLAILLSSEGRSEESLDITRKAIERFVIDGNPTVYNLLQAVIRQMAREGRAKEALELTVSISRKVRPPTTFTDRFFYHYAFATCYINLGKADQADKHILMMDSMETQAERLRGPLRRATISASKASVMMKRGHYRQARDFYEEHFTSTSYGDRSLSDDLEIYRNLIEIDSVLGDAESGIAHYKKYTQLLDSNFRVTKIRQAEELEINYQINDKENQIASLTQEARLEKANSDRAVLANKITFGGIIAATIIALLLYWQNRLRRKTNNVITLKNEQLRHLLDDKEWLLKEIHHRVKNNLQIVVSLLNSQSVYINNEAALAAIHDSQRRIHTMALIHQRLYQSEDISYIPMAEYIHELVTYIRESFETGSRLAFEENVEPVNLDVSQAIPLGLIINEGIVNAIKYAFPGSRRGKVKIILRDDGGGMLLMQISDNGMGLPEGLDLAKHDSLGLDLIKGLTKQLNGTFNIENKEGLTITVRFLYAGSLHPERPSLFA